MTTAPTERESLPCPEPGVYPDVSTEEYHAWQAASKSVLWKIRQSPLHAYRALVEQDPQTKSMLEGEALHCNIFEPAEFDNRFRCMGNCEVKLKSGARMGDACGNQAIGLNGDGVWACGKKGHDGDPDKLPAEISYLSPIQWSAIPRMYDAVFSHPYAADMLSGRGQNEISVVWNDPRTGVRCKARIDRAAAYNGGIAVVDLKTARDADPWKFRRDALKLGYHVQAAHYLAGSEHTYRLKGKQPPSREFYFIVVESSPDVILGDQHWYRVEVLQADDDFIEQGMAERDRLLDIYAECMDSGHWPYRKPVIRKLSIDNDTNAQEIPDAA